MKRHFGAALMIVIVAAGAYAAADNGPQPPAAVLKVSVQSDSAASSKRDNGYLSFWPKGDAARIELVHVNVPNVDFTGVRQGWQKYYWNPRRAHLSE